MGEKEELRHEIWVVLQLHPAHHVLTATRPRGRCYVTYVTSVALSQEL